jgi:hypothetical protein
MARQQLFSLHDRVELPATVLRTRNNTLIHQEVIDRFPFVRWPSGQPCEPVNAYLLDIASNVTGDKLKTYAAELSPLVRYCASAAIGFEQLDLTRCHDLPALLDCTGEIPWANPECEPAYSRAETLLLGVDGKAIRKTSLEKDFERLVKAAGHTDVQACSACSGTASSPAKS